MPSDVYAGVSAGMCAVPGTAICPEVCTDTCAEMGLTAPCTRMCA